MATELAPVAVESGRVELAWKYLIPRPLASAFSVLTLLLVVERPVESEVTLLAVVLMPLDAEVESEPM
jgi:heme/copper-type cytochrome/quinol oxidase subunit 4